MGELIGQTTTVKKSRTKHDCFWCGEEIPKASSYAHWVWAEGRELTKVKCHSECASEWSSVAEEEGGCYEIFNRICSRQLSNSLNVMFGDNGRPNQ